VEVVAGDVTDPYNVSRAVAGCEVVFHLAALIAIPYSYVAPAQFVEVNCRGVVNLLEAARTQGVARFVHTSTSEAYGTAQYVPMDELHPLKGQSPYAASKIGADKLAESYHLAFGVPVVTVRPFNTYGPRQSARAIVPTIITQGLTGRVIRLGRLTPVRDLTFVTDTVTGFLKAAETPEAVGEVVNLGSGAGVAIGALADLAVSLLGGEVSLVTDEERFRPEASEVMQLLCDAGKARRLLGWAPRVSLEEGLTQTIASIREHLHLYKPHLYNV